MRASAITEDLKTLFGEAAIAGSLGTAFMQLFQQAANLEKQLIVSEAQSIRASIFGTQKASIDANAAADRQSSQIDFLSNQALGAGIGKIVQKPLEDLFGKILTGLV